MSAILGRLERDGKPVNEGRFASALDALQHYGGDATCVLVKDNLAFGFQGLTIARRDVPDRHPVHDGPLSIVADAILDDRDGLCDALGIAPAGRKDLSDSTLILRAYDKWGVDCPDRLLGDFAFAVFDKRTDRLFLARDHIGARPLYWARQYKTFVFATDIRGLLAFDDLDWRLDETMVARFLKNTMRPMPKPFFEDMHSLKPGHRMVVDAETTRTEKWWHLDRVPDVRCATRADYVARLRDITEQSVACRVQTDAVVGSHISGGIDSTTITHLAQRAMTEQGRGLAAAYAWAPEFSETFPDMGPMDERHKILETCGSANIACSFGEADDGFARLNTNRLLELDGTTDLIDELPVMQRAQRDGVRVMLSGWGGDEAFSAHGFGYLASLIAKGRLVKAYKVNRHYARGVRNPVRFAKSAWASGVVPMLPDAIYKKVQPFLDYHSRSCFADPSFLQGQKHPDVQWPDDMRPHADPMQYIRDIVERGHLGARINTWAAWSAAHGIQYRYPLTDRRLIEFILGVPPDILFHRGRSRYLAKSAFNDLLPVGAGKSDPANEAFRARFGTASLMHTAKEAETGELDIECDWIDQTALKARLDEIAKASGKHDVFDSIEVFGAILILKMVQRHQQRQGGVDV